MNALGAGEVGGENKMQLAVAKSIGVTVLHRVHAIIRIPQGRDGSVLSLVSIMYDKKRHDSVTL